MEDIEALCRAVEVAVSRKISVYSDFKWLSQKIYESTHEQISHMTLMRAWGYVGSGAVSKGTLNILAHFLGYMSYEDFAASGTAGTTNGSESSDGDTRPAEQPGDETSKPATATAESAAVVTEPVVAVEQTATEQPAAPVESAASVEPEAPVEPAAPKMPGNNEIKDHPAADTSRLSPKNNRTTVRVLCVIIALLLAVVGWGAYALVHRQGNDADNETFILRKGERFASCEDYLPLFGITNVTEHPWSQPLPHHNGIIVFGGQYHHPHWGNEGDSTDLLPTRTEYWHDDSLPPVVGERLIREHYYVQKESNRLIITFMKDLVDTSYVFCGVYRMSQELSDTTHVVWERVAEQLDLRNLDYLEQLRN